MNFHTPVLAKEVIDGLNIQPGNIYIDATLGNGGHTLEILKLGGIVYGIEQDTENLKIAAKRIKDSGFENSFFPIHSNFNKLENIVQEIGKPIAGLLLDLGLSQNQQTSQGRGFSFNDESSLDMRLDPESQEVTAEEIINTADFDELYEIFTKYAQEKYSKPLILKIIRERQKQPIKTATRLATIIRDFYKKRFIKSAIDPSTKIFMALRIAVNNELDNLKNVLDQTLKSLPKKCVVCVITFHSGEDRIVKQFIRQRGLLQLLKENHKSAKPSFEEIKNNPLSRSATLRSYTIN